MASLLDKVLTNKDNPTADQLLSPTDDKPHTLEDGSVVYDSTFAAIERILAVNPHLHKRKTGIAAEPYRLYNGHTPIDLTDKQTFFTLLRADWSPTTPWQTAFLVEQVIKRASTLSRDCIIISEGLLWDRESGKLRTFTEDDNIRTVS